MRINTRILLLLILWHMASWSENSSNWPITSLKDIGNFDKNDLHHLRHRYKEYRKNDQLFSRLQYKEIQKMNLLPTIGKIILHKDIYLSSTQELMDFSREVVESKLSFDILEPRIIKYLNQGKLIFPALTTAINREQFHRWKEENRKEIINLGSPFITSLQNLALRDSDYDKVINVYATCIAPFKKPELNKFFAPTFCDPINEYSRPRCWVDKVSVCETLSDKYTDEVNAYRLLVKEAKAVLDLHKRNAFERLVMAKCIAEQSLKFFTPSHHPLKSLNRIYAMERKSPEDAFFMSTGICGNFSGIAYNIANKVGLKDHVFLAKRGVHIYLELEDHGLWYHAHPFNSKSRCHFTFFNKKPSGEEMHH